MKTYKITWEMELDAKNPKEAAKEALDCIQNGTAKVFEVTEINGRVNAKKVTVDLYQDLLKELNGLDYNLTVLNKQIIEYHRNPTPSEIKFGYGAIHYRDFNISECLKPDGGLKKRLKGDDKLIYTR